MMYITNIHMAEQDNVTAIISVHGFPSNVPFPIVMIAAEGRQDNIVTQKLFRSD